MQFQGVFWHKNNEGSKVLLVVISSRSFMPGRSRTAGKSGKGIVEAAFDGLQAALERFAQEGGSIKQLPYQGDVHQDTPWYFNRRLDVVEGRDGQLYEKWETTCTYGNPWTPHRHV